MVDIQQRQEQQQQQQQQPYQKKLLIAFDFDHTIVHENSDTWIYRAGPDGKLDTKNLNFVYKEGKWTEYMGEIFNYMGSVLKVPSSKMKEVMQVIPFTEGFRELLDFLKQNKDIFDCIIISDSNTLFIQWILEAYGFGDLFCKIYTNFAEIDDQDIMRIKPYHVHKCISCPMNMCKCEILEEYLVENASKNGVTYEHIFYVGDGGNDFCPSKSGLYNKKHFVMARTGYSLEKKINKLLAHLKSQKQEESQSQGEIQYIQPFELQTKWTKSEQPQILFWKSGTEIIDMLQQILDDVKTN